MKKQITIMMITTSCLFCSCLLQAKLAPVEKQIAYAEGLFSSHQYDTAIDEYIKVISLYPDNEFKDKAQLRIGDAFAMISANGVWFAIGQWNQLIEKYPSSPLVEKAKENIKLALMYLQKENPTVTNVTERIMSRFIRFGTEYRWSSSYEGGYGRLYFPHFKEASIYWIEKAISEGSDNLYKINAILERANLYNDQQTKKDYLLAIDEYQKIVNQYPDTSFADSAQVAIGDIYENSLRNRKAALEAWQKLIDKKKDDKNNYYVSYAEAQINYFK